MSEVGTGTWRFPSDVRINDELLDNGFYFGAKLPRTTNQSIPDATWTDMHFTSTEWWDYPNVHSTTLNANRYTPGEYGTYNFKAWVQFRSTLTTFKLQAVELRRNGTSTIARGKRTGASNPNGHWNCGQAGWTTVLNDTDYVTLRIFQDNSTTGTGAGAAINCTGFLMVQRLGGYIV